MQNYIVINFPCTSCCILPTIFKKPTILGKIVGFVKIVGKILQQLVQKRLQEKIIQT